MILRLTAAAILLALAPAQSRSATAPESTASDRKVFTEPSSTSLAGGKARLIISPLVRQPGIYAGSYQLKVTPYFFKNETGKISITVSDQALLKLAQNTPLECAGKATSDGSGKTRPVNVKATPSAKDRGALTISIETENGTLVFETSYRIGAK